MKKIGNNILMILTVLALIIVSSMLIAKIGDAKKIRGDIISEQNAKDSVALHDLADIAYPTNIKVPKNSPITDAGFYKCAIDNYNSEKKTKYNYTHLFTNKELASLKSLTCTVETKNLKGIEKMTSLEVLKLKNEKSSTTSIDLSKNTKLNTLFIYRYEKLTSINLTKNTKLTHLDLSDLPITSINLTKNTSLTYLDISNLKKLKTLNLTKNTKLTHLDLSDLPITSINLTKNTKLIFVSLQGLDALKSINLTININLKEISIRQCKLIKSLNLTKNTKLENLDLTNMPLTSLNLTKNTKLKTIFLSDLNISKLNLSKNKVLYSVWIRKVPITAFDLSNNSSIEYINFENMPYIGILEVSNCKIFRYLIIDNANNLMGIDLSNNPNLYNIEIKNTPKLISLSLPDGKKYTDYDIEIPENRMTCMETIDNTPGEHEINITDEWGARIVKVEYSKDKKTWKGLSSKNLEYANGQAILTFYNSQSNLYFRATNSLGVTQVFGPYTFTVAK